MISSLPLIAHATLAEQVRAVEDEGFTYFPQVVDNARMAMLRELMDRLEADSASFDKNQEPKPGGFVNKHINNAFNRDPLFLDYVDFPGIVDVAEALHGNDCHIIGMTAWITGPGRPDQTLHADWLPVSLPADIMADQRVKIPVFITTVHYYLNDIDEELGPTTFVPGSHRSGRTPEENESEWNGVQEQGILCRAGDAVIFRCEVWHRGRANTSQRNRYLLQVHYAQRMITQKFPPYLNRFQFNEGILAHANSRQLRLLGDHVGSNYD